jgi:hypothetical protein
LFAFSSKLVPQSPDGQEKSPPAHSPELVQQYTEQQRKVYAVEEDYDNKAKVQSHILSTKSLGPLIKYICNFLDLVLQ